jgi:hypothetical protein
MSFERHYWNKDTQPIKMAGTWFGQELKQYPNFTPMYRGVGGVSDFENWVVPGRQTLEDWNGNKLKVPVCLFLKKDDEDDWPGIPEISLVMPVAEVATGLLNPRRLEAVMHDGWVKWMEGLINEGYDLGWKVRSANQFLGLVQRAQLSWGNRRVSGHDGIPFLEVRIGTIDEELVVDEWSPDVKTLQPEKEVMLRTVMETAVRIWPAAREYVGYFEEDEGPKLTTRLAVEHLKPKSVMVNALKKSNLIERGSFSGKWVDAGSGVELVDCVGMAKLKLANGQLVAVEVGHNIQHNHLLISFWYDQLPFPSSNQLHRFFENNNKKWKFLGQPLFDGFNRINWTWDMKQLERFTEGQCWLGFGLRLDKYSLNDLKAGGWNDQRIVGQVLREGKRLLPRV